MRVCHFATSPRPAFRHLHRTAEKGPKCVLRVTSQYLRYANKASLGPTRPYLEPVETDFAFNPVLNSSGGLHIFSSQKRKKRHAGAAAYKICNPWSVTYDHNLWA